MTNREDSAAKGAESIPANGEVPSRENPLHRRSLAKRANLWSIDRPMRMKLPALAPRFLAALAVTAVLHAADTPAVPMTDNPLLTRYEGSVLVSASSEHYASLRVPESPGRFGKNGVLEFDTSSTVEGQIDAYLYIAPRGKTALEVFRNYQLALSKAGFTTLYRCEMQTCDKELIKEQYANESVHSRKWGELQPNAYAAVSRDIRFVSAKHQDTRVVVYVAEPSSIWDAAAVVVIVAQPTQLETGKVVVDSRERRQDRPLWAVLRERQGRAEA